MTKKIVSLCFSGHPRAFLPYRHPWHALFDLIKEQYELRLFFHSWSETGYVREVQASSPNMLPSYTEGQYEDGEFSGFDELITWMSPNAYAIESNVEYTAIDDKCTEVGPVLLNPVQATKRGILSQLYSISTANRLRQIHDESHGRSDVVYRLRFDLIPTIADTLIDIERVISTNNNILLCPSPEAHRHAGGGGGCRVCATAQTGLCEHRHANDICDIYASGSPAIMDRYCSIFEMAPSIWRKIDLDNGPALAWIYKNSTKEGNDRRMNSLDGHQIENVAHCFYPEKLIRYGLSGILAVDSTNVFQIKRR